jgi:broad specificity phosphatase PhoE
MTQPLPQIYLARHGETAWTLTGQHTGLTDLPLTGRGERNAVSLGERLAGMTFGAVWTSPLLRARQTCDLAGLGDGAIVDDDLVEWNYGDYEGLTTPQIRAAHPGFDAFHDGYPGGESVTDMGARADRVVAKLREAGGDIIVFSHGHFLRFLAARWLGLPPTNARYFLLGTAALSAVGYEHKLAEPVIRLWNDDRHVQ